MISSLLLPVSVYSLDTCANLSHSAALSHQTICCNVAGVDRREATVHAQSFCQCLWIRKLYSADVFWINVPTDMHVNILKAADGGHATFSISRGGNV